MANPEHLEILNQGVETWNKWRKDNPKVIPDLSNADLEGEDLQNSNLSKANLKEINFGETNLTQSDLSWTNLYQANLRKAILYKAKLTGADLCQANFRKADLRMVEFSWVDDRNVDFTETDIGGASLIGKDLSGSDLSGLDLHGRNLRGARLNEANLYGTDLSEANLAGATFVKANLDRAMLDSATLAYADLSDASLKVATLNDTDLTKATLTRASLVSATLVLADLKEAKCGEADLTWANLRGARLIGTNLDGATLSGATLEDVQLAGWSIKGIICECIYWDGIWKDKSVYRPGEFERLYADKTKVKLFYKDGISPLEIATLPALIHHIEASHTECKLRFQSIEDASGGAIVTLAIDTADGLAHEYLDKLRQDIQSEVQRDVHQIRQTLEIKGELIQRLNGQVESLQWTVKEILTNQKPTYYLEKGNIQMGDTHQNYGQTSGMGRNVHAHDMTFNQVVSHFEQSIDLPALAKQLAELREEMAKRQDSSTQTAIAIGKIAEAEKAAEEKNPSKVMESLKAAGQWTLDFAKEVGKDLAVEAIKLSVGMP
jgi:uncharacterized protein YjbI with pentapeptide repeats